MFVNNLRVRVNPKHANKSFKHISIVYERLAGGYGIGYSEPLTCRFGQVDSCERCIEVKIQFSEVGRLAVGDSCMLLAISKAKFQLEPGSVVIIQHLASIHGIVCREIKLPLVCSPVHRIPDGQGNISFEIFCINDRFTKLFCRRKLRKIRNY